MPKNKKNKKSKSKSKSTRPSYADADLVMHLYDLRREEVLRANRDILMREFWPRDYDEFLAVTEMHHEQNTAFRQVSTYWEMVLGMARHGIADAEYLVENSREGLFHYAKCEPFVERYRQEVAPTAFAHAEWAATRTKGGREFMPLVRARIAQMQEQLGAR